ncbi:MAG TPA: DUF2868 domain-containing protein [Lamprocystis sp. (in: g-proteobacteria)]|nr:DUF2868 domain-containing protein [Lamprocystis sp. (in: g-proteobacteria)]
MKSSRSAPPDDADADADGPAPDRWTVADLIDLEYYLGADETVLRERPTARATLTERDRSLYLDEIGPAVAPAAPHTADHRRLSLLHWLRARRAGEPPEQRLLLPGSTFAQAQRLITLALAVVGFLLGIGAASALLSYDGHRPININWYIFILVVVQLLLIGGVLIGWLVRRSRPVGRAVRDLTLLGRLIRPLVARVSQSLQRQHLGHASQEAQDRSAAQVGRLRSQYALYGPVSFLPTLIPAQVLGVAFNLGVVLTTIALEWFTDLAFGWESALDISPQVVYDLARTIAWPWGWLFGEGAGYPSLDQVAGSRVSLKDALSHLDAAHLRSWRWFLVLAVVTYGLLPRLLLLAGSVLTQRHLLDRLRFTQGRTQALYARLLTPKVETATHGGRHGTEMPIPAPVSHRGPLAPPIAGETQPEAAPEPVAAPAPTPDPLTSAGSPLGPEPGIGTEAEPGPETGPESEPVSEPEPKAEEESAPEPEPGPDLDPAPIPFHPDADEVPGGIAADACLVLIQLDVDELVADADRTRLAALLARLTAWRVAASASFGSGSAMTAGVVSWVEAQRWAQPPARVAVIMDGSQPPITENLRFLRELRAASGAQAQILLALVGDPQDDDPLPPVRAFDFTDWQRKVDQLADPYLRLEMLAGVSGEGGD